MVALDARRRDDVCRIPGAKVLSPKATTEEVVVLIKVKETLVVTYCAGPKCPASARLATRLAALGYSNIIEYPQGIAGWAEAGHPVENATK